MKRLAALISTVIFLSGAFASLNEVITMVQVEPGLWNVICQGGTHEKRTTTEILENRVCGVESFAPMCIEQVVGVLPYTQYNDTREIHEIKAACEGASLYSFKCRQLAFDQLIYTQRNDRSEVIEIVNACSLASSGTSGCIIDAVHTLVYTQHNDRREFVDIIRGCVGFNSFGSQCVGLVTDTLLHTDYNDLDEYLEILDGCSQAMNGQVLNCFRDTLKRLPYSMKNDRQEVLEILRECK